MAEKSASSRGPVAIVGGGLGGLHAARLLAAARVPFLLLEARSRLGGRILSEDGFDLGPAWFWPDMQPSIAALVGELGLAAFPQYAQGDVLAEQAPTLTSTLAPARYPGFGQMASSFRIAGGIAALVAALAKDLPEDRLRLGVTVTGAALRDEGGRLTLGGSGDAGTMVEARAVLFALPPRLIEKTIAFAPALSPDLRGMWRATPTWMAPHAKFLAVYAKPFWRGMGLCGTAQSSVGPMVEIHDASAVPEREGGAALFGFVGVPASARARVGETVLRQHCLAQFARLFGAQAETPLATRFKDWAADPFTATADDGEATGHPEAVRRPWFDAPWSARAVMAGSETAPVHPGYLEGALLAAEAAVARLDEGGALS
ncbi:MAG: FAD-dependent oxidoreductase [Alphaproteobacteria bacterium]|nr:FAD-dependent oxidoreductase [Alphaproteobacteria bacterium]